MKPHLLIVEDDAFVQALLAAYMDSEGFRVSTASSGGEMFAVLGVESIDLIVLDLGLPDEDGLVLARQIRARSSVPIIVLTMRQGREDRIAALEVGADDFLTKPCDPQELILRIRNILGRSGPTASGQDKPDVLKFGEWVLDLHGRTLTTRSGRDVSLTPAEFNLLTALARAPNRVLSRPHLLDAATRYGDEGSERMIDVVVSRLRKKIEADPRKPQLIVTVPGFGYKIATPAQ